MTLSRFSLVLNSACASLVPYGAVLILLGCAPAVDPSAMDYHSQESESSSFLWTPPDMAGTPSKNESAPTNATLPAMSSDPQSATWSAYQRNALGNASEAIGKTQEVMHASAQASVIAGEHAQNAPFASNMHLEHEGTQYWLVVQGQSVEKLLPQVEKFWQQQDFELKEAKESQALASTPEDLVIETQWRDMPASVNTGFIRGNISKIFNTGYVARQKNKYRTRIKIDSKYPYTGSTGRQRADVSLHSVRVHIFISQTALREVRTGPTKEVSQWELAPYDALSEALYLQRLMQALAKPHLASEGGTEKTAIAASPIVRGSADTENNAAKAPQPIAAKVSSVLNLNQPFDHAWFETGLALEQLNFTVEDRDRTKGLYYVRYVDPNDQSVARQGFWSQLVRGRKEKNAHAYALNVRAIDERYTRIAVLTSTGEVDTSLQAQHIIALINEVIQREAVQR